MSAIGDRLYTMRKSRGLTQYQLAEKMGLSRSSIGMYEQGKREPDLDTIEAFADVFNVPVSAIVEGDPEYIKAPSASDQKRRAIIDLSAYLTDRQKDAVLAVIRSYIEEPPKDD